MNEKIIFKNFVKKRGNKKMKKLSFICLVVIVIVSFVFTTGISQKNDSERVLRMAMDSMPRWDPASASGTGGNVPTINIHDSLVVESNDGSIKPRLAKDWKVSDDGLRYTFYLREGVKFHNGDELTSEDVVFSIKRFLTIGEGFGYLFVNTVKDAVEIDKYTVEFTINKPFGPFLSTLIRFYVVNKDQILKNIKSGPYGDMGDYGKDFLLTHDAGSGPYMVKKVVPGDYIYIERYDDYWGGWDNEYAPTGVKMIVTQEAITIRTMMQNKELEIGPKDQTVENLKALMAIPGIEIGTYSNVGSVYNITLNNKKAPTDDVNVRKALSYLVDYDTILKYILIDCLQAMGPVSHSLRGHNPNLFQYSFDIEKAKEYLQKSKYANKLDQYPLEIVANSAVPDQEKIALMLQASAKKVGLKLNISKAPWINICDRVSRVESTPNMVMMGVGPGFGEAGSELFMRYHSRSAGSWQAADWLQNEEIDEMIDDALSTIDTEERFAKYRKIQEILVNDIVPSIWLVDRNMKAAYHADYVYWPLIELIKDGKSIACINEGNIYYFRDFKIYPEKMK